MSGKQYYRLPEKGKLVSGQGFETGRRITGVYDCTLYGTCDGYKMQFAQILDEDGKKNAVALFTLRDATAAEEAAYRLKVPK